MSVRILTCAAMLLAISGCNSIDFGSRIQRSEAAPDLSGYFAQRLEAGRQHLASGRPTKAIEAFRQASYDARYTGDALNGMAVAYTQLGRDDVARRLFERAVENDPLNDRYARNLARLEMMPASRGDAPVLMAEEDADRAALPVAITTNAAAPTRPVRVRASGGTLTATAREVNIRTSIASSAPAAPRSEGSAPVSAVAVLRRSRSAGRGLNRTSPVRIEMPAAKRLVYATRMEIPKARSDQNLPGTHRALARTPPDGAMF